MFTETGIERDAWRYPCHGGPRKAVLLITAEGIDEVTAMGFPLYPGALGENVTSRGVDRHALRLGQRLRIGAAEIELVSMRVPCTTLNVYGSGIQAALYDAAVAACDPESPRWGLSGFYAAVIRPGVVKPGDAIRA